jgi:hypothetical protein
MNIVMKYTPHHHGSGINVLLLKFRIVRAAMSSVKLYRKLL